MTWDELLNRLEHIPISRRNEKAIFISENELAFEIDDLSYNTDEEPDNNCTHEIIEGNSIYDNEAKPSLPPITLTP